MTQEELLRSIAAQQSNVPEGFIRLRYHHDGGAEHYHVSYEDWNAIYPIEKAVWFDVRIDESLGGGMADTPHSKRGA